jgi:hypothetical protein
MTWVYRPTTSSPSSPGHDHHGVPVHGISAPASDGRMQVVLANGDRVWASHESSCSSCRRYRPTVPSVWPNPVTDARQVDSEEQPLLDTHIVGAAVLPSQLAINGAIRGARLHHPPTPPGMRTTEPRSICFIPAVRAPDQHICESAWHRTQPTQPDSPRSASARHTVRHGTGRRRAARRRHLLQTSGSRHDS